MTINSELTAQILRYYHVEKWRVNTIARQLGVHHGTVARVLAQAGLPALKRGTRPSAIEPYWPFIHDTLTRFPTLTASRLYAMVRERGYRGETDHFRHLIALHRPRPVTEAYLRLRTLPGEQAQVDWGHFGHLQIGRARRPLMAFVTVLSYSRQIYLSFFLNARLENFLRGHVGAFEAWGGVPRILLYDNLKSAVLERQGQAIRFHPALLNFAGHHRFEPRPVAVARGNEKGRVERAIRYVRDNFFAARTFTDVADLNAQAQAWCTGPAADRPCPEAREQTVRDVFSQEQGQLVALPLNPYPLEECTEVHAGKTPYVRFDLNDYSIPHTHVRRTLTLRAGVDNLRILDGTQVLACHPRSYDKGAQIENPAHIATLVDSKRAARTHRGTDQLAHAVPISQSLLAQAAARGEPLRPIVAALLRLLRQYGATELHHAIDVALARGVPHPHAVRAALEQHRRQRNVPVPVVTLPDPVTARDTPVQSTRLEHYDTWKENDDDKQP